MKKVTMFNVTNLAIMLYFVIMCQSCGKTDFIRETLRNNVDTDTSNNVDVRDLKEKNKEQDQRLDNLESQVSDGISLINSMQTNISTIQGDIMLLQATLETMRDDVDTNQSAITSLEVLLDSRESVLDSLITQQNSTQDQVNALLVQMSELNDLDSVNEIVDPCGDWLGGYDEVLLRMRSGKLLAYFESGSNRFLSELKPGNYQTTDGSACNFTVNASFQVISN